MTSRTPRPSLAPTPSPSVAPAASRQRRRRLTDRFLALLVIAAGLAVATLLGGLVLAVVSRGLGAVSWGFITGGIEQAGAGGGILYPLLGTLLLVLVAALTAGPWALGGALYLGHIARGTRRAAVLRQLLLVLNGIPSIVFGIAGMLVFVFWLGWGKSWLAGGLLLGVMILPTVTTALLARIEAVPRSSIEAATGLGLDREQVMRSVILPQSLAGLWSGLILGLARAAGETAPIMFTAVVFDGATLPQAIVESPVLALPYHIFVLAQDSFAEGARERLWGAALVLLALVTSLSLVTLPFRRHAHEHAARD